MNRYIERAENYARFLDVNFNLTLEQATNTEELWRPLIITTGDWDTFITLYDAPTKTNAIKFLGFDEENPNSIYNCIINARENARAIRPEITKELWEQINYMYFFVREGNEKKKWRKQDPREFFNEVKKSCHLFYGIMTATISRNNGWHIGHIGRLLERGDKTSRILDVKCHTLLPKNAPEAAALDIVQWAALLKSVSAYDMYRKKHGSLTANKVLEFLIFDEEFPRSVARCVIQASVSVSKLSGRDTGYCDEIDEAFMKLCLYLRQTNLDDVFEMGLHEYLDDFQMKLIEVSNVIYDTIFSKTRTF
jgi:uncharacterized alpha-E superfamily protein